MRDLEWRLVRRGWLTRDDVERATGLSRPVREWVKRNVPWLRPVRDEVVFQVKRPYRALRKWWTGWTLRPLPDGREWRSLLSNRLHISIMRGQLGYMYRGMRCVRNPFDLALYLLILQELKPRTVIEIGSKEGGHAA
jgi:hypothetical protein